MKEASLTESTARKYAELAHKRPFLLLFVYMLLAGGAVLLAKYGLDIRTDLESLLPQGSSSVAALDESRVRTGSTDLYTVAIQSPDADANLRLVRDLVPKLEAWEENEWVQIDQDSSFFSDRALLYLPKEDLARIRDQLEEEVRYEKKLANPMFIDLRTKEEIAEHNAKRWAMDRWLAPDLALRLGLDNDLFNSIMSPDKLGLPEKEEPNKPAPATDAAPVPQVPSHLTKYLMSARGDGYVSVILSKLSQPATDVVKSKELFERGAKMLEEMDLTKYHPEMRASIVGAYSNFNEVKSISDDSTKATLTSLVLVLVLLIGFFRNARSVLLLIFPMLVGVTWSVGLTALTYGHLNISTLFVFTMLIGLGIDFGIHYYSRILEEFRAGRTLVESITQATLHSGRAMLSAALTTIVALLTLLAAHFKGFVEFGVIASYGIALCFLAFIFVLPPALFALERIWKSKSKDGEAVANRIIPETPPDRLKTVRSIAYTLMVVGVAGSVIAVLWGWPPSFEYNFRNLRAPSTGSSGISYGAAVGRGKSTSPAMILGNSVEQMRGVHKALSKNMIAAKGEGYIKSFVTVETYVPPGQDERLAIVKEMNEMVNDPKIKTKAGRSKKFLDRMKVLTKVDSFTIDDIPVWAKRSITERDGSIGKIGFLYSTVKKWDALDVQNYQDELGIIDLSTTKDACAGAEFDRTNCVRLASSGFILADVIRTVESDTARLAPIVFFAILLVLLIDLRSFKGALVCLSTMAVALLWTVGAMAIFDIRVGLYNMIVLPMVLGTGIDGSIHIYHRTLELGPKRIVHVLKTTGLSVIAASCTTLAGFAGLLVVLHKGVKSIGDLAVFGILATLLAVLSFMPGLLMLVYSRHKAASDQDAEAA